MDCRKTGMVQYAGDTGGNLFCAGDTVLSCDAGSGEKANTM